MTSIKGWVVIGDDYLIHREVSNTRKEARSILAQAHDRDKVAHRVQRVTISWNAKKRRSK